VWSVWGRPAGNGQTDCTLNTKRHAQTDQHTYTHKDTHRDIVAMEH